MGIGVVSYTLKDVRDDEVSKGKPVTEKIAGVQCSAYLGWPWHAMACNVFQGTENSLQGYFNIFLLETCNKSCFIYYRGNSVSQSVAFLNKSPPLGFN